MIYMFIMYYILEWLCLLARYNGYKW